MALVAADSSSSPFLRFDYALLTDNQRMRMPRSGDVFTLVADDRCNPRFEVLERFDWSLHGSR
jgi:hypothetical protein